MRMVVLLDYKRGLLKPENIMTLHVVVVSCHGPFKHDADANDWIAGHPVSGHNQEYFIAPWEID